MDRRGFMAAILAAGAAPVFVKAGILMPVKTLWTPTKPGWAWSEDGALWVPREPIYEGNTFKLSAGYWRYTSEPVPLRPGEKRMRVRFGNNTLSTLRLC